MSNLVIGLFSAAVAFGIVKGINHFNKKAKDKVKKHMHEEILYSDEFEEYDEKIDFSDDVISEWVKLIIGLIVGFAFAVCSVIMKGVRR